MTQVVQYFNSGACKLHEQANMNMKTIGNHAPNFIAKYNASLWHNILLSIRLNEKADEKLDSSRRTSTFAIDGFNLKLQG